MKRKRKNRPAPAAQAAPEKPTRSRDWAWAAALMLAVFATYLPVWSAVFIWDDDLVVTNNPAVVEPDGLAKIWSSNAADICPLTLTTFYFEHALWGAAPLPYHLVNVLLHAGSAVLLWFVLRRLRVPGAWLGAALWALHPVQVESVAWVTELKNCQSGFLYLLCLLFFLRSVEELKTHARRDWSWNYALGLIFAAAAMASKSSTVILPLVLCLCAWWMEGRWNVISMARTIPVFFMSCAAAVASMWTQGIQLTENADAQWVRTWPERLATAGDAIWFYLGKLIWPYPLLANYPRWQPDTSRWISYLPLAEVFLAFFALWWWRSAWSRAALFTFAYFVIALLPVIGLADMFFQRFSLVADHFQYLASMGPLALAGAGLALAQRHFPSQRWLPATLTAALLLLLGVLSAQWAWLYQDDNRLWTYVLAKNPDSWLGHNRMGVALMQQGRVDAATAEFQKTLAIYPNFVDAISNLSVTAAAKGRLDDAITYLRRALAINPDDMASHFNLAQLLMRTGRLNDAIPEYQAAFRLDPHNEAAHASLAIVYLELRRDDEAEAEFKEAIAIYPGDPSVHHDYGSFLARKGRMAEAIAQYEETLRLKPDFADTKRCLAQAQAALQGAAHH